MVTLAPGTAEGSSDIFHAGFSEKVDLGVFKARADGSLRVSIKLPSSMGSGTHLILVEFTDPSGQKKRLYEFIEVRASEKKSDVNIQEHRSEISRTKQDDVALAAKSETVTDFKNIPSSNHRALLGEQDKKKMNASHENTLNSLQSLILLVGVVIALVGVFIYGKSRPN